MEAKKADTNLAELDAMRLEQDAVDLEIIQAIAKRLVIRKKISTFRIENDLPTIDPGRREYVLKQAEKYAEQNNMPPAMAHELFNTLIDWSHRLDREWRTEKK